jgi:hypothetical protein
MCTHIYTSHRHYYSSLLSTHLPFSLAGWLTPTHLVGHNNYAICLYERCAYIHIPGVQKGKCRNMFLIKVLNFSQFVFIPPPLPPNPQPNSWDSPVAGYATQRAPKEFLRVFLLLPRGGGVGVGYNNFILYARIKIIANGTNYRAWGRGMGAANIFSIHFFIGVRDSVTIYSTGTFVFF